MRKLGPIGLFDSGVGGLSIYREIKKDFPHESTLFLADQANIPYGGKSQQQIRKFSKKAATFLIQNDAKLIVVACNTASCYAIDYLRGQFKIPIIGVVPAIKPAANITKAHKVAIMATPATIKSAYLNVLIAKFAQNTKVLKIQCHSLEEAIENQNEVQIEKLLTKYAQKINKFGADVLVLGCTHYPFIKHKIANLIQNVKIIDSSQAVAKRVKSILVQSKISPKIGKDKFFTTSNPQVFSKVASSLLKYKVKAKKAEL